MGDAKKRTGSIWLLVAAILSALVAVGMFVSGHSMAGLAAESLDWPSIEGTITRSDIVRVERKASRQQMGAHNKSSTSRTETYYTYDLRLGYKYTVDDRIYTGQRIQLHAEEVAYRDRQKTVEVQNRYPQGKAVTVYYDPERPEVAALKTGSGGSINGTLIAGGFFFGLAVYLLLGWRRSSWAVFAGLAAGFVTGAINLVVV